jgi:hypothetical protein
MAVMIAACGILHGEIARAETVGAESIGSERDWRIYVGPIGGVMVYDPDLANYRWDIQPSFQSGLQATVQQGRFGAGARVWRAHTTQATGIPGETQAPTVTLTGVEFSGQARVVRYAGAELWGAAHGGWLHMGYDPDQLAVNPGITVAYDPISEWDIGAELQLRRDLSRYLALAVHGDWTSFAMDTAHRAGSEIVYSRERFHAWSVYLEVAWILD